MPWEVWEAVWCGGDTTQGHLWPGHTHAIIEQVGGPEGRGASPLWLRMWISRELALGQLLRHWGKGQMRSLGYGSLGFSSMAAVVGELAFWRLAQ